MPNLGKLHVPFTFEGTGDHASLDWYQFAKLLTIYLDNIGIKPADLNDIMRANATPDDQVNRIIRATLHASITGTALNIVNSNYGDGAAMLQQLHDYYTSNDASTFLYTFIDLIDPNQQHHISYQKWYDQHQTLSDILHDNNHTIDNLIKANLIRTMPDSLEYLRTKLLTDPDTFEATTTLKHIWTEISKLLRRLNVAISDEPQLSKSYLTRTIPAKTPSDQTTNTQQFDVQALADKVDNAKDFNTLVKVLRKKFKLKQCNRCGLFNHSADECKSTRDNECHLCDENGHFSHICPDPNKTSKHGTHSPTHSRFRKTAF